MTTTTRTLPGPESTATERFRAARDLLLSYRIDRERAVQAFQWPRLDTFNWTLDWFGVMAHENERAALWIVEEDGRETRCSFAALAERSNRLANGLRAQGVARGDRLIVMLGNQIELWETLLAAMKLGAVIIPASTLLGPDDLRDRVERGAARHVADAATFATVPGAYTRIAMGAPVAG